MRVAEDLHFDVLGARGCSARGTRRGRPNAAPASRCASSSLRSSSSALLHDAHAAAAAAEARLDHQRDSRCARLRRRPRPDRSSACSVPGIVGTPAASAPGAWRRSCRRTCRAAPASGRRTGCRPPRRRARTRRSRRGIRSRDGSRRRPAACATAMIASMFRYERTGSPPCGRADQERFVGLEPMQREAIFVAVDRDGAQAELGGGPEAADGDLRAVGDEQFPHG